MLGACWARAWGMLEHAGSVLGACWSTLGVCRCYGSVSGFNAGSLRIVDKEFTPGAQTRAAYMETALDYGPRAGSLRIVDKDCTAQPPTPWRR